MEIKVIITGTNSLVGEGILLECLSNPQVKSVLVLNNKNTYLHHPKIKEIVVSNLLNIEEHLDILKGYDVCFYCPNVKTAGVNEATYTHLIYNTTLNFAKTLLYVNPKLTFNYVTDKASDSTEKSKIMTERINGKTVNALMNLPFKKVYNFRTGLIRPSIGQQHVNPINQVIDTCYPLVKMLFPNNTCSISEIGKALINTSTKGYPKHTLNVPDIKICAAQ